MGQPISLLALSNSCAFANVLGDATRAFDALYKRKAHVHHFTQYMDSAGLDAARETVRTLANDYARLPDAGVAPEALAILQRLKGAPT